MQYNTSFFLVVLAVGFLVFAPLVLRADIVPPDDIVPTFENQQKLAFSLEVNGEPFAADSITNGTFVDIRYRIGYAGEFFAGMGDMTPEEKAEAFRTSLEDHRLLFELWKGEPFTPSASVERTWGLPPATEGSVSMILNGSGPHFLVAYLTNEVNNQAAYCARYEVPEEVCSMEGYFSSFPLADTQAYFTRPLDSEEVWSDAFPTAFGGKRFTITDGSGVSNVLFLPGIKGSRLYRTESKLWEPSGSEDVRHLFLDENGKSAQLDVHVRAGDVLSEVLSRRFYASFFGDLDALEDNGTFGEGWTWEAAAYDWRLSLTDIVTKGARYDDRIYYNETDSVPYLERLLRELAAASATRKVSVVAHSNGGLVAKALMRRLGDAETSTFIDKVIFVGVPQSGAPQALGAALFGYGEALPFDGCANWPVAHLLCAFLTDRATARTFAARSPMTYHLLPSEAYFRDVDTPVARFDALSLYQRELVSYGNTLDTFDELSRFARAEEGGRTKPEAENVRDANVLSASLLAYARDIHAELDGWTPPVGVEVYQIAGWGRNTLSGIAFYEEPRPFGDAVPRYRPLFFSKGDGVVPAASGLMMEDTERYWADVETTDTSHANLFEMQGMRTLLRNILINATDGLPAHIYSSEPVPPAPQKKFLFFLHSPLTLGLYDAEGNYTGANEDGTAREDIDDIEYGRFGEVQYLIAPFGEAYTVVMRGLDEGSFSLDVQEQERDFVIRTTTFANVPATADTVATLKIAGDGSLSELEVDENGDGVIDHSITPQIGKTVVLESEDNTEPPASATTTPPVPEESPTAPEPEPAAESSRSQSHTTTTDTSASEPLSFTSKAVESGTTATAVAERTTGEVLHRSEPRILTPTEPVPGGTPNPRTQTASVYDAFARAKGIMTKPMWLLLLAIALVVAAWKLPRRKEQSSWTD